MSGLRREAGESRGLKAQLAAAQSRIDGHRTRLNEEMSKVRQLEETLTDLNSRYDEIKHMNERLRREKEKHDDLSTKWARTKANLEASVSEANDQISLLQVQNVALQKKVKIIHIQFITLIF